MQITTKNNREYLIYEVINWPNEKVDKTVDKIKKDSSSNSLELLDDLAKEGKIDGVEVFHYSANEEQQATLLAKANEYDLIVTGGSDIHALYNMKPTPIGMYTTDKDNIDRILKLCNKK